jgi:hypothetical protein
MKWIFSTLVLALVLTTSAYAEQEGIPEGEPNHNSQKPVNCMSPEQMLTIVDKKFGEKPYMSGDGIAPAQDGKKYIKTQVVIAVNMETKTFSVVEFIADGLVCIVAGGNNFRLNNIPSTDKTKVTWEK